LASSARLSACFRSAFRKAHAGVVELRWRKAGARRLEVDGASRRVSVRLLVGREKGQRVHALGVAFAPRR